MVGTLVAAILMAAIGVRCSLSLPTATKAMTWTIALWLGSDRGRRHTGPGGPLPGVLFCLTIWSTSLQLGLIPPGTPPWFPMGLALGLVPRHECGDAPVHCCSSSTRGFGSTGSPAGWSGGAVEVAVDRWLHGHATRPSGWMLIARRTAILPHRHAMRAGSRRSPVDVPAATG